MLKDIMLVCTGGLIVGVVGIKAAYHKGRLDAYRDCEGLFITFRNSVERMIKQKEEESK